MASWRDNVSQLAQDDLDALLNAALPFAELTIGKYGEMFPFGARVNNEGEIAMMAVDMESEHPQSLDVIDALRRAASQDDTLRAVAITADVVAGGSDAIRIEFEHREGVALTLLAPYSRSSEANSVMLGDLSAGSAERKIWSA